MITLNPDLIKKIFALFSAVTTGMETVAKKIEDCANSLEVKDKDANITDQLPRTIVEKTEFISLNDIKQLANAYKPTKSDGMAVAFAQGKDKVNLYMTYVKGRSIINNLENTLIVISAEAVSKQVKELFANDSVIILK